MVAAFHVAMRVRRICQIEFAVDQRPHFARFDQRPQMRPQFLCDCRFGKMDIFHRYEEKNAEGSIQFSIVNMVEPGSFNLEQISTFTTPGVSFFLLLPGPADPLNAFECMVETAGCLVRNLNGRLLDDAHSSVSEQTLEHCRQKIRDFLQQQLVAP